MGRSSGLVEFFGNVGGALAGKRELERGGVGKLVARMIVGIWQYRFSSVYKSVDLNTPVISFRHWYRSAVICMDMIFAQSYALCSRFYDSL